jgi:hypothetical protein
MAATAAAADACFSGDTRVYWSRGGAAAGEVAVARFCDIFDEGVAAVSDARSDHHPTRNRFRVRVVARDNVLRDATVRVVPVPTPVNVVTFEIDDGGSGACAAAAGFSQRVTATPNHRWFLADAVAGAAATNALSVGDRVPLLPTFAADVDATRAQREAAAARVAAAAARAFPAALLPRTGTDGGGGAAWLDRRLWFDRALSAISPETPVSAAACDAIVAEAPLHGAFAVANSANDRVFICAGEKNAHTRAPVPAHVRVVSIAPQPRGVPRAFCFEEEVTHSFVLAGGIVTGNCAFAPAAAGGASLSPEDACRAARAAR